MLRFRFTSFLLAALLWSIPSGAQSPQFLSVIEDLPLMAGLHEVEDGAVYFDTPKGRIVEQYAVGTHSQETVLTYYKESLPSLGWKRTAHGTYVRDGEYLSISVRIEDETAVVRFALSPDAK